MKLLIAPSVYSLVLLCFLASFVSAQQATTATLSGRITDPNSAVVAGALITAAQTASGVKRETTSNDEGYYVLSNLPPGDYTVRVESKGFITRLSSSPIQLQVGQDITLNIRLEIGVAESMTVDLVDYQPLIDSNTSVVGAVIDSRGLERLPLNGRNFLELALLIPGNSPAPNFDPTKTNTVVISSAGQLGRGGNVTVDGADNNDDVVGGAVQNISQEAVQEFQVATNRFSAQLGRSGSSVVNIVTKSGTNEFHGSGAFYFRHKNLQGLPATFDRSLGQVPPFHREQYAFAMGGPIKKDKAWFFGSFEYRNQKGAVLVGERNLAMRSIVRSFASAPFTTRCSPSVLTGRRLIGIASLVATRLNVKTMSPPAL